VKRIFRKKSVPEELFPDLLALHQAEEEDDESEFDGCNFSRCARQIGCSHNSKQSLKPNMREHQAGEVIETIRELDECLQCEACADNRFGKYEPMPQGFELKVQGRSWNQKDCQLTMRTGIMLHVVLLVTFLALSKMWRMMAAISIIRLLLLRRVTT
jgi:hypothetical protein